MGNRYLSWIVRSCMICFLLALLPVKAWAFDMDPQINDLGTSIRSRIQGNADSKKASFTYTLTKEGKFVGQITREGSQVNTGVRFQHTMSYYDLFQELDPSLISKKADCEYELSIQAALLNEKHEEIAREAIDHRKLEVHFTQPGWSGLEPGQDSIDLIPGAELGIESKDSLIQTMQVNDSWSRSFELDAVIQNVIVANDSIGIVEGEVGEAGEDGAGEEKTFLVKGLKAGKTQLTLQVTGSQGDYEIILFLNVYDPKVKIDTNNNNALGISMKEINKADSYDISYTLEKAGEIYFYYEAEAKKASGQSLYKDSLAYSRFPRLMKDYMNDAYDEEDPDSLPPVLESGSYEMTVTVDIYHSEENFTLPCYETSMRIPIQVTGPMWKLSPQGARVHKLMTQKVSIKKTGALRQMMIIKNQAYSLAGTFPFDGRLKSVTSSDTSIVKTKALTDQFQLLPMKPGIVNLSLKTTWKGKDYIIKVPYQIDRYIYKADLFGGPRFFPCKGIQPLYYGDYRIYQWRVYRYGYSEKAGAYVIPKDISQDCSYEWKKKDKADSHYRLKAKGNLCRIVSKGTLAKSFSIQAKVSYQDKLITSQEREFSNKKTIYTIEPKTSFKVNPGLKETITFKPSLYRYQAGKDPKIIKKTVTYRFTGTGCYEIYDRQKKLHKPDKKGRISLTSKAFPLSFKRVKGGNSTNTNLTVTVLDGKTRLFEGLLETGYKSVTKAGWRITTAKVKGKKLVVKVRDKNGILVPDFLYVAKLQKSQVVVSARAGSKYYGKTSRRFKK